MMLIILLIQEQKKSLKTVPATLECPNNVSATFECPNNAANQVVN